MPLLLEPDRRDPVHDPSSLAAWSSDHQEHVDDLLRRHGAMLFRGFGFRSAECFESFASSFSRKFMDYRAGFSPRSKERGLVYTSTEVPSYWPIPLHCEMAYVERCPARVLFYCHVAPTRGGETPIADMEEVYEGLDPTVRSRFEGRNVRYIHNLPRRSKGLRRSSWSQVFETEERAEVETVCRLHGFDFRWEGDSLQVSNTRPATLEHPVTGRRIWFNSTELFHAPTFPWELRRVGRRCLAAVVQAVTNHERRARAAQDRHIWCTFGDGTEIDDACMEHVREVHWRHSIVFRWQQGDVLLLDNTRIAHAKLPFKGPRKILVAMLEAADSGACHGGGPET